MKLREHRARRVIVTRLYSYLRDYYSVSLPDDLPIEGIQSLHYIDALLAFKTDSHLDDLRSALERLDEGTFGQCLSCKRGIAPGLLDVEPTRRFCAQCERTFSHLEAVPSRPVAV